MKRSSKKLISTAKTVVSKTGASRAAQPIAEGWVVKTAVTGRFDGMAKTSERLNPVIIPGYKTRG